MRTLLVLLMLLYGSRTVAADLPFEASSAYNQLETRRRLDDVRQQLRSDLEKNIYSSPAERVQRSATVGSTFLTPRSFAPSISTVHLTGEQKQRYLDGLGEPDKETGIFAYPSEQRLYRYGRLCIEVGLVDQGVRAISDYLQQEQSRGSVEPEKLEKKT